MISHKHKCIFIHIPRCAGTSMELAIGGVDIINEYRSNNFKYKHLTAAYSKILYKDYWNDYYKFSFVRNPYDRMVSMAKGGTAENNGGFYGVFIHNNIVDISKYKHRFPKVEFDPRTDSKLYHSQPIIENSVYQNILNEELDFVGRFENLHDDFNHVCKTIGVDQELPYFKNTASGNRKCYTEYYNNKTRKLVAQIYAEDLKRYGYEF